MPQIEFNGKYDPYDMEIFQKGDDERVQRHSLLSLYWDYYYGNHRKFLKATPGSYDDNVTINLCSQAVDRTVAFLLPEPPKVKYTAKKHQKKLSDLWEKQPYIRTLLTDVAISGLVSGHVFLRLDNSNPDLTRFVNLDPRLMTVFWDTRNAHEPLWYRMTWGERDQISYTDNLFIEDYVPGKYVDGSSGWFIFTYKWNPTSKQFITVIGEEYWDYPFAPIIDWKAQPAPFTYYGPSLLKHLHVNDIVNFLFSNTNRILRFHAHPKTIILGAGKQDLQQTSIDQVWAIPVVGAEVFNLEMQSELNASIQMFEQAKASFFAQTHVVDTTTNKDRIGQITNFGLHVLFSDMLDNTRVIQQLFGMGLKESIKRAMAIMGESTAEFPEVVWVDPLPVNRSELVNAVKVEQSVGVTSNQSLAEMLNRDFNKEQERIKTEQKKMMLNLGEEGMHDVADLPIAQKSGSTSDKQEYDDNDRLQRAIESI